MTTDTAALIEQSTRPDEAQGIKLHPLKRNVEDDAIKYEHVEVAIDRAARTATITTAFSSFIQSRQTPLASLELFAHLLHLNWSANLVRYHCFVRWGL